MVDYKIFDDRIEIYSHDEFNIKHILECGQVFRFKPTDFGYTMYSMGHKADVYCQKGVTKIFCKNQKYWCNYLDLNTNYATIKVAIGKEQYVKDAVNYGYGIRILRQDPVEMIISFIISANNNIPRIKYLVEKICEGYGTNMGDYYAFPTLQQLAQIPEEFFRTIGCGYRAAYLVQTIKALNTTFDVNELYDCTTEDAKQKLLTLQGVGPKVADCVLLFGYHKTDVFPTDTWIIQAYQGLYGDTTMTVKQINKFFQNMFGQYSGYAQQYLFYSKREKLI